MKLFQQLLVAPAALGLLAPVAANAAEMNVAGVSDYASVTTDAVVVDQVTSVTQFSDVYPTDWAYQALSNLVERYGCVAGYPNGTFRGNRAMTRYEAAALLNACLDRITEVTDELKRLMKEFEKELAILKGRVDGLEARVGELEATQFSTTTKMKGKATFVIGSNSFGGDANVRGQYGLKDKYSSRNNYDAVNFRRIAGFSNDDGPVGQIFTEGKGRKMADVANEFAGATTFNYDYQLDLLTSFTGKDLLKVKLRSGNFGTSTFGSASLGIIDALGTVGAGAVSAFGTQSAMEIAYGEGADININRLFYQFPLGSDFTVTAGGIVRQDDMLAVWPSAYPSDTVLDFFTYAGAPGAYNLNIGAGAGVSWAKNGWSVSANYVSANGGVARPDATLTLDDQQLALVDSGDALGFFDGVYEYSEDCSASGGIANDCSQGTGTVQIAYTAENWGLAAAYNYSSQNFGNMYAGTATPLATLVGTLGNTNSFGLSGYWSPEESSWIPSISAGWGINSTSGADYGSVKFEDANGNTIATYDRAARILGYEFESATTQSWYVGLQWKDVFLKGNSAGMAVGQKGFVTALDLSGSDNFGLGSASKAEDRLVRDGQYAWEWWYMFQVTDNITVTPAVFYLSRPLGAATQDETFTQFGGLVKTTFTF